MLNAETFLALLAGQALTEEQYEEVETLIEKVPYAGLLHLLAARYQCKQHSHLAPQKIRRAALHMYTRKQLADALGMPLFQENDFRLSGASDSLKDELLKARNVLDDIQKEVSAFDEKLANASEEELDQELEKITTSYTQPKDYFSSFETKEDIFNIDTSPAEGSSKSATVETSTDFTQESSAFPQQDELSESYALALYSEGKIREAVRVYEALKKKYPERVAYYQSQIDILMEDLGGSFAVAKETPTSEKNKSIIEENKEENKEDETTSPPEFKVKSLVDTLQEAPKTFYTELDAIRLRDEGKDDEAIKIYERLILQHPEKKTYFEKQIQIIKGL
jgi:tetratricopeptide (TPR) repeat protein